MKCIHLSAKLEHMLGQLQRGENEEKGKKAGEKEANGIHRLLIKLGQHF